MLSYALRHNPSKYKLEIDGEGWTSINKLLIELSSDHYNNDNRMIDRIVTRQDIEEMIACSNKVRFELRDDKIRALYGHSSTFTKINKIPSKPPAILYHGTTPSAINRVMSEGLKPMNRQYVHLSTDENTAAQVGKRKIKPYTKRLLDSTNVN